MPAGSFAKWAEELKWVTDGGAVNKKRVERLVTSMSNQRPKLVRKVRNKWTLTDEGKEQARAAALKFERECLSA
jgi:hypothetical protein